MRVGFRRFGCLRVSILSSNTQQGSFSLFASVLQNYRTTELPSLLQYVSLFYPSSAGSGEGDFSWLWRFSPEKNPEICPQISTGDPRTHVSHVREGRTKVKFKIFLIFWTSVTRDLAVLICVERSRPINLSQSFICLKKHILMFLFF